MTKILRYLSSTCIKGCHRVSSHQLEIENGRANRVRREKRMCRQCHLEVEDEENFTCRCPSYVEIRENYDDILGSSPSSLKF